MHRRKFISTTSKGVSLLMISSLGLSHYACTNLVKPFNELYSLEEVDLLNAVAEVVIPTTGTPGGKAAKVGEFIASMTKDCFEIEDQAKLKTFLSTINQRSEQENGKKFLDNKLEQKQKLIAQFDQEADSYFPKLKSLLVSSYLSSEIGSTQFLKYPQIPGRYEGCTSTRPW